ncbi:MAG: hypothetical protein LUH05_08875 [Candidatus Gastranaerophilales bacterium]|nr:hypothetical protein [Candidatus Gastranaerophilales bacterium]
MLNKNFIQKIFSIKNNGTHKILTILGIKIKFLQHKELLKAEIERSVERLKLNNKYFSDKLINVIKNETKSAIIVANAHQKVFLKYNGINLNRDVVIVATGPSLKYYKPVEDAVHIGVNRSVQFKNVNLDYLFLLDYKAIKGYIQDIKEYDCIKFCGWHSNPDFTVYDFQMEESCHIPKSVVKEIKAEAFYVNTFDSFICDDISSAPLIDFGSTTFPAIHFSIYTNPKRIFLVGCDCTFQGYFDGKEQPIKYKSFMEKTIEGYKKVKDFVRDNYFDVEIISINPVGLKGVFRDVYTKEFLDNNPKIKDELGNDFELLENLTEFKAV